MMTSNPKRHPTSTCHVAHTAGLGRACQFCRLRKIRCDNRRPRCGSCINYNRQCIYVIDPPKQRPSRALIDAVQREKRVYHEALVALKKADSQTRDEMLDAIVLRDGTVDLPPSLSAAGRIDVCTAETGQPFANSGLSGEPVQLDENHNITAFLSRDERGKIAIFGPSSALHVASPVSDTDSGDAQSSTITESDRLQLIANAALQRQREHDLRGLPSIGGISSELAMHLLDLHWNRQHHTFLLTYRPAFMRDLVHGGPYCSEFLLNAVFACSSKFSERIDVRDDPNRPETTGKRFFERCDELLAQNGLLECSSIPTIAGLLMLGSTFNARGLTSKGWLYTGYALRMVYDLGLHLDCKEVGGNAEDIEVRRRVFWAAFICDKLQSLYLGRPFAIQLRDAHVSWDFIDTFEEMELWTPYVDPQVAPGHSGTRPSIRTRIHSVSTFQHLCSLSRIMATIIEQFYVLDVTTNRARTHLRHVDEKLQSWYQNLPKELCFEPWLLNPSESARNMAAPNIIILLTTYHALVILLHRPLVSNGHLHTKDPPTNSWERCVTAARNITSLAIAYQSAYALRRANYLLSYAVYVACTIHARNPAIRDRTRQGDVSSPLTVCLRYLDELAVPNCGVSVPARIVRRLMEANDIPMIPGPELNTQDPYSPNIDIGVPIFPETTFSPDALEDPNLAGFQPFMQDFDLLFGFMNEPFGSPPHFNGVQRDSGPDGL